MRLGNTRASTWTESDPATAGSTPEGTRDAAMGLPAASPSGFGGLGLEGIMGREDSAGVAASPLGDGRRGKMSGDSAGDGVWGSGAPGRVAGAAGIITGDESGAGGRDAGAAEMVEMWCSRWEADEEAMSAINIPRSDQKEAINKWLMNLVWPVSSEKEGKALVCEKGGMRVIGELWGGCERRACELLIVKAFRKWQQPPSKKLILTKK